MTESKNKQKIKAYDDMIMLEQHTEDNLDDKRKKKKHGRTVITRHRAERKKQIKTE